MGLNDSQRKIVEKTEGMLVVDAGPGTGKTKTITERYCNIIETVENVDPQKILLMTFTNNAAIEMSQRLKARLMDSKRIRESKLVQAKTFDSFCLGIVMDSPDQVSSFFGVEDKLSHNVRMSTNETLNREYFLRYLDDFLSINGDVYGDYGIIATEDPLSILFTIEKLMSRGIVPLRKGWFGMDADHILEGDAELIRSNLKGYTSSNKTVIREDELNDYFGLDREIKLPFDDEVIEEVTGQDRSGLKEFIHDVFYGYVCRSIKDNRLTFGLVSTFAFVVLFNNHTVRERNKFTHVMIDEFQDTNANQLMIALMILEKPNLCVVGDWKQGIYGFRYVSIENITRFEERVIELRRYLNDDYTRVPFSIPEIEQLPLDTNYRSSEEIIRTAFDCLYLKATQNESVQVENVTMISQGREDIGTDTHVRYVKAYDKDDEPIQVVKAIKDYIGSGKYIIHDENGPRPPVLGDIAVISNKNSQCVKVQEACEAAGIPSFLYGDVNIMATREGKLALAWLRFISNEQDPWGYIPILADMNYTLKEMSSMGKGKDLNLPYHLRETRERLRNKRRRITELLTSIFEIYGLDNDITQAIIANISSVHRSSLLTISDIIRIIEEDIRNNTTYDVERSIDTDTVSIMTMHKSKGLEFPIVIIPYIDKNTIPKVPRGGSTFIFDPMIGLRCTKEIGRYDGFSKICPSWRTLIARKAVPIDYDEQRRLMFVAMSRAKQYETVITGNSSPFFDGLSKNGVTSIPDCDCDLSDSRLCSIDKPEIGDYVRKRTKFGVHDIMQFSSDEEHTGTIEGCDEVCSKGMEYGDKVHKIAYQILKSRSRSGDFQIEQVPEVPFIERILESLDGAILDGEVDCGLPVPGMDVTLRGKIDLIAVYPDWIEIHDYKTDSTNRFEDEYRLQLSVYAHAAMQFYDRPAKCFIDYISQNGKQVAFEPMPISDIAERVSSVLLRGTQS